MNARSDLVDWDGWPLAVLDAARLDTAGARRAVVAALAEALDRGGQFALVAVMPAREPGERGRPRPREALEEIRRLRAIRGMLAERCRGLALVLDPEDVGHHRARRTAARRFWGCPVEVAARRDTAVGWARGQLRGRTTARDQ